MPPPSKCLGIAYTLNGQVLDAVTRAQYLGLIILQGDYIVKNIA